MKKRDKVILTLLGVILFNILLVSATIEITQPLEKYNFGDSIFTTVTLNPQTVSGSFEINVVCGSQSANVYKIAPAESAFSVNQEQKINHQIVLTKEFIGNLSGTCNIVASLGEEVAHSNNFLLSGDIIINAKIDKTIYNPGETIRLEIEAQKINELPLNGFIEISGNLTNSAKEVVAGKISELFQIPNNSAAGKYEIILFAYDKDENGILNQKRTSTYYTIAQVPTKIEINLLNLEATPGQSYEFTANLFDQSGLKMNDTLSAFYISEKGEKKQISFESGSTTKIEFSTDATAGKYFLTVSKGTTKAEKEFTLLSVPKIDIQFLENSSVLIVKNIGNVAYNDSLNITIGETATTIPLTLALGEEKKFNLQAPNGMYSVTAQSGESTTERKLLLTGDAVSIREGDGTIIFEASLWIWVFIVAILVLLIIVLLMKYKKRTFKSEERYNNIKETTPTLEQVSKKTQMQKQFLDLSRPRVSEAESNLSMKGSKDICSVISLKIKNKSTLGMEGNKKLNELLEEAGSIAGVVDMRSQHILIIFSPLMTKTSSNEIVAAKFAFGLKTKLDEYNKRFQDKISYNIGVHSGEMINSLNNGKLNYTSIGNSIILAKRISDLTDEKLLVSGTFRQKLLRELKVQKINHSLGDVEVFEVQRIADVTANEEKLKELLKRVSFS